MVHVGGDWDLIAGVPAQLDPVCALRYGFHFERAVVAGLNERGFDRDPERPRRTPRLGRPSGRSWKRLGDDVYLALDFWIPRDQGAFRPYWWFGSDAVDQVLATAQRTMADRRRVLGGAFPNPSDRPEWQLLMFQDGGTSHTPASTEIELDNRALLQDFFQYLDEIDTSLAASRDALAAAALARVESADLAGVDAAHALPVLLHLVGRDSDAERLIKAERDRLIGAKRSRSLNAYDHFLADLPEPLSEITPRPTVNLRETPFVALAAPKSEVDFSR